MNVALVSEQVFGFAQIARRRQRALDVLHQALAAAETLDRETPFSSARIAHFRNELFAIREDVLALMATLRER